jgi:hypothetical protein
MDSSVLPGPSADRTFLGGSKKTRTLKVRKMKDAVSHLFKKLDGMVTQTSLMTLTVLMGMPITRTSKWLVVESGKYSSNRS